MGARLGKSEVLHTFFPAKPNHSEDEKLLIISPLKGSLFQQPQSPRQHLPCPCVQQAITTPLIAVQVILVHPSVWVVLNKVSPVFAHNLENLPGSSFSVPHHHHSCLFHVRSTAVPAAGSPQQFSAQPLHAAACLQPPSATQY